MRRNITILCTSLILFILSSCASLNPVPQNPDVKLVGLRILPSSDLLQKHIAIDLKILNPNKKDLSIRSINYTIGIENINVLNGATGDVPTLKALQETPVTLEVSVDLIQFLRLAGHFMQSTSGGGAIEKVNYNFSAVIDFSAWLPSMHVDKKGAIALNGK